MIRGKMMRQVKLFLLKLLRIPLAVYHAWYGYYSHSINRYKEREK
jgi:hypothetical protein